MPSRANGPAPPTPATHAGPVREPAGTKASIITQELLLPRPTISGQTPSQRIFSVASGINARALRISRDDSEKMEFWLFMELREEQKWVSFKMTPFDWICATSLFNTRLEELYRAKGHGTSPVLKVPRALMEKLGDIERDILVRLVMQDFMGESY